jgi:hypothetical protein
MSKPKAKRGDPKSDFFRLDEDAEWDTMKAQVMAKIDMILKPATISYDDYDVQFSIPRYSPQLIPLANCEKYTYMVEYALKAKSSPSAKIMIEGKVTEKQKVRMQLPLLLATRIDALFQKSGQKGKENIIEISDSEESDSEAEKKKRKKRGKGSKVSVCVNTISLHVDSSL